MMIILTGTWKGCNPLTSSVLGLDPSRQNAGLTFEPMGGTLDPPETAIGISVPAIRVLLIRNLLLLVRLDEIEIRALLSIFPDLETIEIRWKDDAGKRNLAARHSVQVVELEPAE
jgi:hypothetical protein